MKILGLSFGYHDSAAALLIDGRVVAAAQEAVQVLNESETTPASLAEMKNYASWFGRETLYYSLQRSAHVST